MSPETLRLFRAVTSADAIDAQRALAAGADVNATDDRGRNIASYAALGDAIDSIDASIQPRLSECRLNILQLVLQHPDISLYSLNAPLVWAGGVTLLGLMSWLNMSTEIMCLLESTQGLVEVNAMDEQGATPLMYAARDGSLQVVQCLLAHGARPDLKDAGQRSALQYALPHPQILWLCESALRRERSRDLENLFHGVAIGTDADRLNVQSPIPVSPAQGTRESQPLISPSSHSKADSLGETLFFSTPIHRLLTPPQLAWFDGIKLGRTFDSLLSAVCTGDLDKLRARLFPPPPPGGFQPPDVSVPCPTPLLVNLRDNTGLTLVHHAVSQRRCVSIAVLDELYRAGSDVGLFSTLGFTPLHHLARTARDDTKEAKCGDKPSLTTQTHALYAFTAHLVRDLHAPLGATDSRGETPMHAAAEHGRSVSVLQAMLDCDSKFTGREAVRQARNERGLRPVDVAKPEFLPLFLGRRPARPDGTSSSQSPSQSPLPAGGQDQALPAPASVSPHHVRPPVTSDRLAKKGSSTSLKSKSSASSSTSSGAKSPSSYMSRAVTRLSRGSHQSGKPTTPIHRPPTPTSPTHMFPAPDPTPPNSLATYLPPVEEDPYVPIDVSACALDLLSNLSFCASALHTHAWPTSHVSATGSGMLPDLSTLSETLLFTRDLAGHILEHWTARIELARDGFERARREHGKAERLHEKVRKEVGKPAGTGENVGGATIAGSPRRKGDVGMTARDGEGGTCAQHVGVQTDRDASSQLASAARDERETTERAEKYAAVRGLKERRAGEAQMREPKDDGRIGRWHTGSAMKTAEGGYASDVLPGWGRTKGDPPRLQILRELDKGERCMVGHEARMPRQHPCLVDGALEVPLGHGPTPVGNTLHWSETMGSPAYTLRSAPRILHRAGKDLDGIAAQLALVRRSFTRAQESIAQARTWIEQTVKSEEDELAAIIRRHHQVDFLFSPSRLPPILERLADPEPRLTVSPSSMGPGQLSFSSFSSTVDHRYSTAAAPKDLDSLHRLLTYKLAKYVGRVFDDLQKAHMWLRIVREVLRGLKRRACMGQ